ncbi:protein rep [Carnobacterium maltaromaticum]|uniref:protein rep n=1 Tax=Carnobacterium maltaromaticum TaxID=2751 RepID=UPI0039BE63BB
MNLYSYNNEFKQNNQDFKVETKNILKDVRKNGKTFDWRGKKIKNLYYADLLEILHFKKANNVYGCADELIFKMTDEGYLRLHQVWFCKSKLCPLCNWRRSLKMSYQNEQIISEAINQYPKARFLFLTLTVKNVYDGKELDKTLKEMTNGFRKLMKYKKVSKNMIGYLRATEVTINELDNSFHPHFHILLMLKPTYFKNSENYLNQEEWTSLWKKAMRIDYIPVVDVRAVKGKDGDKNSVKKAVLETSKYPVKDSDYLTNNIERDSFIVNHLETGLYRKRQIGYGLLFKEIRKALQLDEVEDGDLRIVGADEEEQISEAAQMIYAKWNNNRKNYFIKD